MKNIKRIKSPIIANNTPNFEHSSIRDILTYFNSNEQEGLHPNIVKQRLEEYGFNEIPEVKPNKIKNFLKKFWGGTAWILEFMLILSIFLQHYEDVYFIIGLLFMNAIIGFFQEEKASNAIHALQNKLQIRSKVLRDQKWEEIAARELVSGDIIRIRSGDFIPADMKVIDGTVGVDQSALTGESLELEKGPEAVLYQGSILKRGETTGIVIKTGIHTFFGKTAQLVQSAHPKMTLEVIISKVIKWLFSIVLILLIITLIISLIKGVSFLEILPLILVLSLSAVPIALPAMFTVTVALGSQTLSKKNVLITRLNSVEDAATMTVLCSDKTGTLTMNKLTIVDIKNWKGYNVDDVIFFGSLASKAANHDSIDDAFLKGVQERHLVDQIKSNFVQQEFIPFDAKRRRTEAVIIQNNQSFRVMKGAVNTISELCNLTPEKMDLLIDTLNLWSQKGYRTIAVAVVKENTSPSFIGIVALNDTLRPDTKAAIEYIKTLGVSVKILTGDSQKIAQETAHMTGLGEKILRISSLKELIQKDPSNSGQLISQSDGFAEIYPEDKFIIVQQLQKKGYIVGMTGDGVNDAPALRQAEVGVAVSNATDVAKSAASAVLTKEGLSGIIDLIKEGRIIYKRIITWILSKIIRTILTNALIVCMFLVTGKYITSAYIIILLLFMTDFVKIALATDNAKGSPQPNSWNISGVVKVGVILACLMFIESMLLFYIGFQFYHINSDQNQIETFTFAILLFGSLFSLFNIRERDYFWKSYPSKTLFYSIFFDSIIALIFIIFGIPGLSALPLDLTLFTIGYLIICIFGINDVIKVFFVKKNNILW